MIPIAVTFHCSSPERHHKDSVEHQVYTVCFHHRHIGICAQNAFPPAQSFLAPRKRENQEVVSQWSARSSTLVRDIFIRYPEDFSWSAPAPRFSQSHTLGCLIPVYKHPAEHGFARTYGLATFRYT